MTILKESQTLESKTKKFIEGCKKGYFKKCAFLLNGSNLFFANSHSESERGFLWACKHGHLDLVRYLLSSPELKKHVDIRIDNYEGFRLACDNGHLEIVKYLLTSIDLKEHADMYADFNYGFRWACVHGYLEIVKYLLTSPDLKEHANIHSTDDLGFRWACTHGNLDVVQYLLSFHGEQCIDFQRTEYNLNWAIENQYDDVILAMMKNLKNNDFMQYFDCLSKVEVYNKELYEQVKNIEVEVWEVNPQETSLFV